MKGAGGRDYKGKMGDQRRAESRVLGNISVGSVSESELARQPSSILTVGRSSATSREPESHQNLEGSIVQSSPAQKYLWGL